MPGESAKVTELEGQVTNLEATLGDLTKKLEKLTSDGGDEGIDPADFAAELDAIAKSLEAAGQALTTLQKERDDAIGTLTKVEALSPRQRAVYDKLDKKDRPAFLDMKDEEKDEKAEEEEEKVKKAAAADEVVEIAGQTIKKSVVGDATFAVMKAQAKEIADNKAELAKQRQEATQAKLQKRADDEFKHVPGSVEDRALMLEAIEKMEEPLKKAFMAVFTQSEKLAKAGFSKIGHSHDDLGKRRGNDDNGSKLSKAAQDWETVVSDIKKRDKCNATVAMAKARAEKPELFKAYQEEGQEATAR